MGSHICRDCGEQVPAVPGYRHRCRARVVDQPPPQPNERTPIWDLVMADMAARKRVGIERYGMPLQAFVNRCPVRTRQHAVCGRPASIEIGLPLVPVPWTSERWMWLGPWCRGHADALGGAPIARLFIGTELVA